MLKEDWIGHENRQPSQMLEQVYLSAIIEFLQMCNLWVQYICF